MAKAAKAKTVDAHIVDEYDLRSGELTKQMVADQIGVTIRAVEAWKEKGKLPATKLRRRVNDDKPKPVLIFMQEDVDKFKTERDAAVQPDTSPNMAMVATTKGGPAGDLQTQLLAYVAHKVSGDGDGRKPFIPIAEAAIEYDLSVPGIHQLISDQLLTRFPGRNGKAMLSRRQIESL